MPIEDFPSNAKTPGARPPEKKIEPVVSGKVIKKKTPLHKKFAGTFFGGDFRSAVTYVVENVLVPSAQKMVMDAITNGSSRIIYRDPQAGLYGQAKPPTGWTPYGKFSTGHPNTSTPSAPQPQGPQDFGNIILEDRLSADRVLSGMYDLLNEYEIVSLSDFYSLLGMTSPYTNLRYGWTDLRGSDIRIVPEGYMLVLPKPRPI